MSAGASLIPELEDVIQRGTPEKCADTLQRITTLFIHGAKGFNEDHVGLFDDVLCQLVTEIESKARAELAQRLAPHRLASGSIPARMCDHGNAAAAGYPVYGVF